jgi:hypothetical protein
MECLGGKEATSMKRSTMPTKYPGVFKIDEKTFRIRVTATDLRTGRKKEMDRLLEGVSAQQAAKERAVLLEKLQEGTEHAPRMRVGAYAKLWIESKTALVDPYTAERYLDALENHILPALGDFYFDALRQTDVQAWVNAGIRERYAVASVQS